MNGTALAVVILGPPALLGLAWLLEGVQLRREEAHRLACPDCPVCNEVTRW